MTSNNVHFILSRKSFAKVDYTINGETLPLTAHCTVFYRLRRQNTVVCNIEKKNRHGHDVYYATLVKPYQSIEDQGEVA